MVESSQIATGLPHHSHQAHASALECLLLPATHATDRKRHVKGESRFLADMSFIVLIEDDCAVDYPVDSMVSLEPA